MVTLTQKNRSRDPLEAVVELWALWDLPEQSDKSSKVLKIVHLLGTAVVVVGQLMGSIRRQCLPVQRYWPRSGGSGGVEEELTGTVDPGGHASGYRRHSNCASAAFGTALVAKVVLVKTMNTGLPLGAAIFWGSVAATTRPRCMGGWKVCPCVPSMVPKDK